MKDTATSLPDTLRRLRAPDVFGTGAIPVLLEQISQAARAVVPDISTARGRKSIATVAARVAPSKVYLDELGKRWVADLKAQTGAIDAERRHIRLTLDALRDEVRAPLTEWEQTEAERQQRHLATIARLEQASQGSADLSAAEIEARLAALEALTLDARQAETVIRAIHRGAVAHVILRY